MADLDVRFCTWQTCTEPALPDQPYCSHHADLVTPDNLRAMLARRGLNPVQKAAAVAARRVAGQRSEQRKSRRSMEKRARARQRSKGTGSPHGRKKA